MSGLHIEPGTTSGKTNVSSYLLLHHPSLLEPTCKCHSWVFVTETTSGGIRWWWQLSLESKLSLSGVLEWRTGKLKVWKENWAGILRHKPYWQTWAREVWVMGGCWYRDQLAIRKQVNSGHQPRTRMSFKSTNICRVPETATKCALSWEQPNMQQQGQSISALVLVT